MNSEAKCNCQHCDGHISFPLEMAGQAINCPHCQVETLLFVPSTCNQPVKSAPMGRNNRQAKEWFRPSKGVWVFLAVAAVAAMVIYWNCRVTEYYEMEWFDSTEDARIYLSTPGNDIPLGTAYSAQSAMEILSSRGWRLVSTRPGRYGTIYVLSRTGLKSPGYISVKARLRK